FRFLRGSCFHGVTVALVLTAAPLRLAHIGPYRVSIRPKPRLRFTAPVRRGVVPVVKLLLARIRHLADVHRFMTNVQAVRAERDLGGSKKLAHKRLKFVRLIVRRPEEWRASPRSAQSAPCRRFD